MLRLGLEPPFSFASQHPTLCRVNVAAVKVRVSYPQIFIGWAHLAPQQAASAVVLRRAPLRHRLGLLLIVAGVVVLDDVILAAEEGDDSCREGGERIGIQSRGAAVTHTSALPVCERTCWIMEACSQGRAAVSQ